MKKEITLLNIVKILRVIISLIAIAILAIKLFLGHFSNDDLILVAFMVILSNIFFIFIAKRSGTSANSDKANGDVRYPYGEYRD